MEFKVGDKVKVFKDNRNCAPEECTGEIGTIIDTNGIPKYEVEFNKRINGFTSWNFSNDELELIKEKPQYTMNDFINKEIAVNLKTQKEYDKFMQMCEKEGLMWLSGNKPTKRNNFVRGEYCVKCNFEPVKELSWMYASYFKDKGWKVISFTDIKTEFTKADLKENHIIINRIGIKRVWKSTRGSEFNNDLTSKMIYKDYDIMEVYIMEVYEFDKLVWKREEESILDDVEKEYLSGVIKPFKNRINYIRKDRTDKASHIVIEYDKEDVESGWTYCVQSINLPEFKKGTMYKNMETGKEYTLEELGL